MSEDKKKKSKTKPKESTPKPKYTKVYGTGGASKVQSAIVNRHKMLKDI